MQILMPKVGLTMTEGTIVQWHKREGEWVAKGEALFTFETEKSTLEFESPAEGALTRILIPAGQVTVCLVPVAEVGESNVMRHASDEPEDESQVMSHKSDADGALRTQDLGLRTEHSGPSAVRRPMSPRAKLRARELQIDVDTVTGSGPDGAVRERDVVAHASNVTQPALSGPTMLGLPKGQTSNPQSPIVRATPIAQRIAAELGIDLAQIRGTGRNGEITREDVERAGREARSVEREAKESLHASRSTKIPSLPHPFTPSSSSSAPLSPIRRITAQRMAHNAQTAPHVTLTTEVDASALVSAREQLNAELQDKISYNALLIAIVAKALREHPGVNASWDGEDGGPFDKLRASSTTGDGLGDARPPASVSRQSPQIITHPAIHIGLAVDTPRGLLVPVVRDCGAKPLAQIHRELSEVVARATAGKAAPSDLSGGTFTITNLGMFEIDAFTPIINLPEAAILGVSRIVKKAVVLDDDRIVPRPMLTLSLSFDHRVIDGAPAAKFLQRVKQLVERPMALILGI